MNVEYLQMAVAVSIFTFASLPAIAPASESGGLKTLRGVHPAIADEALPEINQHLDQEPVPRNFAQQPPLIPHRTRDYKINLRSNKCLTCHHPDRAYSVNAPPVPVSHFINREGVKEQRVSGRRYFCVQCHVPQDGVQPPVANTFTPARAAAAKGKP